MPLRVHEDILIFYAALPTYNPQFTQGKPYKKERPATSRLYVPNGGKGFDERGSLNVDGRRYPIDVQQFKQPQGAHPAQKPTALLEYLIRTYTNEGETVLDATMGSGSTGVACMKTGRNFIGFELEEKFYDAKKSVEKLRCLWYSLIAKSNQLPAEEFSTFYVQRTRVRRFRFYDFKRFARACQLKGSVHMTDIDARIVADLE